MVGWVRNLLSQQLGFESRHPAKYCTWSKNTRNGNWAPGVKKSYKKMCAYFSIAGGGDSEHHGHHREWYRPLRRSGRWTGLYNYRPNQNPVGWFVLSSSLAEPVFLCSALAEGFWNVSSLLASKALKIQNKKARLWLQPKKPGSARMLSSIKIKKVSKRLNV